MSPLKIRPMPLQKDGAPQISTFVMLLQEPWAIRFMMLASCFIGPNSMNSRTPAAIMPFMQSCQFTVDVSWAQSKGTSSLGSVPLGTTAPVEFRNISHVGGLNLGSISFSTSSSFWLAGFRSEECAVVFSNMVDCRAPAPEASVFNSFMADATPAHMKPFG